MLQVNHEADANDVEEEPFFNELQNTARQLEELCNRCARIVFDDARVPLRRAPLPPIDVVRTLTTLALMRASIDYARAAVRALQETEAIRAAAKPAAGDDD